MKLTKNRGIIITAMFAVIVSLLLITYALHSNAQNVDRGACSAVQGEEFIGPKDLPIEVCFWHRWLAWLQLRCIWPSKEMTSAWLGFFVRKQASYLTLVRSTGRVMFVLPCKSRGSQSTANCKAI